MADATKQQQQEALVMQDPVDVVIDKLLSCVTNEICSIPSFVFFISFGFET